MTQYLLDTNIASYIIKGHPAVRRRLIELRYGVARMPAASRLNKIVEEFLVRVVVHPWDSAAAQKYGQIRASLERTGGALGNLDTMIAAHALSQGSVLVTHVKRLKIEDWMRP